MLSTGSAQSSNAIALAETNLLAARKSFATGKTNAVAGWQLGQACFVWGQLVSDRAAQEKIYHEGAAACRRSIVLDSNCAPAHYYLGMNVGRIANLKRNLSAFGLVQEVEKSFERARVLDEKFGHAGPDRNLGLLYQYAPGWPVSVGDKRLAQKHLKKAVQLSADYPENRLNLAEAALAWKDRKLARSELTALQKIWPVAKTNLLGLEWQAHWIDWEQRRSELEKVLPPD